MKTMILMFICLFSLGSFAQEQQNAPKLLGIYAKLVVRKSLWEHGVHRMPQRTSENHSKKKFKVDKKYKEVINDTRFQELVKSL